MTARLVIATLALAAIVTACGVTSSPAGASPSAAGGVTPIERLVADQRAFDGRQITVMGSLVEIGGTPILCAAVAEVFPDGCSVARLVLVGPVPGAMMGQTVTVTGTFRAERGPAAMQLEVL
ncbi:MAG: hypothetical protein WEF51_03985, partial [Chloroflexota bacterium]